MFAMNDSLRSPTACAEIPTERINFGLLMLFYEKYCNNFTFIFY